eukprot:TRINITY_DN2630_c0_g2_i1.p1 TRINITY_DN2630_c0_g2~~TRINITY_DN2630_c0_g2_i1.p1  ORF type:complete len:160 (+),score=31.53 TRINITY_DN2630_c0_g2_i1:124-603(+)
MSSSSPVASMAVWTQRIKKEKAREALRMDFSTDPKTLRIITEKPQQTIWTKQFATSEVFTPSERKAKLDETVNAKKQDSQHPDPAIEQLNNTLRRVQMTPAEKYEWPLTTNQEYGWDTKPLVQPDRSTHLFQHGLKTCELSSYVSSYISSQHASPFRSS